MSEEMFESLGHGEYFECDSETGDKRVSQSFENIQRIFQCIFLP